MPAVDLAVREAVHHQATEGDGERHKVEGDVFPALGGGRETGGRMERSVGKVHYTRVENQSGLTHKVRMGNCLTCPKIK